MSEYRSGFVTITGRSNVGKSTLINALVGAKIAITADKPQTTRNRIVGIRGGEDYQIVFIDTPGIHTPRNRLGRFMMDAVRRSLDSVDRVLLMLDAYSGIGKRDSELLERMNIPGNNVTVLVNKTDIASRTQLFDALAVIGRYANYKDIMPVSAVTGDGLDVLLEMLVAGLEPGPQYFPDDMVTDQPERVIAAEIIREKAIRLLDAELPHGIGVDIEKIALRAGKDILDIYAVIYCEKKSHKGMIIGRNGTMLRCIGELARAELEELFDRHINLQLWVKLREDWRDSDRALGELGYKID